MTQILLYKCEDGIALAMDSRAVAFGPDASDQRSFEVRKLFHLTPHVVAVTGGAGYGILLCERFRNQTKQMGVAGFEEAEESASSFFPAEVAAFRQGMEAGVFRPDLDRVYFLVAGYLPESADDPFRFTLLGSENANDPVHKMETTNFVAIPRQLSIEYRMARLDANTIGGLGEIESRLEKFLLRQAESDEDIGPPFYLVRITRQGIKVRMRMD